VYRKALIATLPYFITCFGSSNTSDTSLNLLILIRSEVNITSSQRLLRLRGHKSVRSLRSPLSLRSLGSSVGGSWRLRREKQLLVGGSKDVLVLRRHLGWSAGHGSGRGGRLNLTRLKFKSHSLFHRSYICSVLSVYQFFLLSGQSFCILSLALWFWG